MDIKLQTFEGPLDLLLHLIQKNKVSIYDIPIITITEQYIEYIHAMQQLDLELASEFIILASELIYMKSRALLPNDKDFEEDKEALAERLIEYSLFKQAAEYLKQHEDINGARVYHRGRQEITPLVIDNSLTELTVSRLCQVYAAMCDMLSQSPNVSTFTPLLGKQSTVFSGIRGLLKKLRNKNTMPIPELFGGIQSRDGIVAAFLALLELIKRNRVKIDVMENTVAMHKSIDK